MTEALASSTAGAMGAAGCAADAASSSTYQALNTASLYYRRPAVLYYLQACNWRTANEAACQRVSPKQKHTHL